MVSKNSVVASAPARVDVLGNATDYTRKGATMALGGEGKDPTQKGSVRAWARATITGGTLNLICTGGGEFTLDPHLIPRDDDLLLPFWHVLHYAEAEGVRLEIVSTIPPRSGLGSSTSSSVAALWALRELYRKDWTRYYIAEVAQAADLRKGQVQGYQDPYTAAFGGTNFLVFLEKTAGISMRGERLILEEPYTVVEDLSFYWEQLGVDIVVAIPEGLDRISGDVNARVAQRYLDGDPITVEQMERKARLALFGKTYLIEGMKESFWQVCDEDTKIMDAWGWISANHWKVIHTARALGAHAKVCGAAGAVAVFYEKGGSKEIVGELKSVAPQVYPVRVAEGVRLEESWPFD